ncbi:MAG: Ribonuclease H [Candidatus Magasanikbacteria bacterium GW2011_GWC2_40_17]|uniref:Ribonuclease H n=1 Tax=Candidatus Magasanikbacteria bacterium GW2011_GWA2_42_32 TaxID=1619039 RepID=A0A0G1CDZ1_9BACT|nr:MAG: Ribonuclease H [Candidatus Magasanikbacteria bacterium GW2011_GWC2_40_17]KKS56921.1 MAG: Ribonuclease H [Candidatus Magasanikbacteria bacterium GW2011_GWA2_42_32]OGH85509.1 MAG: hypothetical protein A2294_03190 [Candidatus Magasanikbacteria bacterium RIFOXYB2_FULL_38_10]
MQLFIYTDGGARGNPGPAAAGIVIKNVSGETISSFGEYLGETTNNQAEYRALIFALEKSMELGGSEITCFSDSELMVKQLNHEYKIRNVDLAPLFLKIHNLSIKFKKISFHHIVREKNKEADKLVNQILDKI